MTQLPLDFQPRTMARTTDVDTSHTAAQSAAELRARQHRKILDVMRKADCPLSTEQISDRVGEEIWRRMSELADAGLVRRTALKIRNRSGRSAYCYELTQKGAAA